MFTRSEPQSSNTWKINMASDFSKKNQKDSKIMAWEFSGKIIFNMEFYTECVHVFNTGR